MRGGHRGAPAREAGLLLLVMGLLGIVGPVAGQDAAADPEPPLLTLEEAQARALTGNPGFRQVTNNLELNRIDRRQAWLGLLPQPSITLLSTNMSWQRQTLAEDNFGEPLERDVVETVQTSRSNQGASMGFVFDFNNVLRIRDQRTQAELRTSGSRQEEQALRADVALAYFDVQEQASALALEEELLASARENRDVALRLYSLGRRERTDVLSAEIDLAEREVQIEDLRGELEERRLALRNMVGDPELEAFRVSADPPPVFDPTGLDEEALLDAALRSGPRLREARLQVETADRGVTMARAEWLPTLSLNVNTNRQEFLRSGDAFLQVSPDGQWSRTMSIALSLPDPGQYFNRQNSTRSAQISLANQEESLRQAELEVDREVRAGAANLRSAHRALELQARRVELAEENLEESLESYRLGRTDFLQLRAASEQAAQARRQELQARFALQRIRIQLERSLGMVLEAPDEGER